ncbi:MAG: BamA/TamA family outer membrane protein [Planctomycetaceae bacterium]
MRRLLTTPKLVFALCGSMLFIGNSCQSLMAQTISNDASFGNSLFDRPVSDLFGGTDAAPDFAPNTGTTEPLSRDEITTRPFPATGLSSEGGRQSPNPVPSSGQRLARPAPLDASRTRSVGDPGLRNEPSEEESILGNRHSRSSLFDVAPIGNSESEAGSVRGLPTEPVGRTALGNGLVDTLNESQPPAERIGGLAPARGADIARDARIIRDSSVQNAAVSGNLDPRGIQRVAATSQAAESLLGEPVAAIKIEGNLTIPTYSIERYITNTRVGRPVSAIAIRDDKTALLSTRWFASVREFVEPSANGPVVIFQVSERPILRNVEFIGNKKFSSDRLSKETGLVPGHGYDVSANRESVVRIERLYREKGYVHARVDLKKGAKAEDREVVIVIDEGPKVAVGWISFEGNSFVSSAVLKTKLTTKSQWVFLFGGTYDPELIRNDEGILKSYYESLGFFDVKVKGVERAADDGKRMYVTFMIQEGVRFKIRNIDTSGNAVLSREQLLKGTKLGRGDAFNSRWLEEDLKTMKDRYDELGRPFAEIQPEPLFLEEPGLLDIVYKVNEDKVRLIGHINVAIRGDMSHTRTDVVRHHVNPYIKPGHLAKASDLRMAKAALQNPIYDKEEPPSFNIRPRDTTDYLPPLPTARGQSGGEDVFLSRKSMTPVEVFHVDPGKETLWGAPGVLQQYQQSGQLIPSSSQHVDVLASGSRSSMPSSSIQRGVQSHIIETSRTTLVEQPTQDSAGNPRRINSTTSTEVHGDILPPPTRSIRTSQQPAASPEGSRFPSHRHGDRDQLESRTSGIGLPPDMVFRGQSPVMYGSPGYSPEGYPLIAYGSDGYPMTLAQQPGMRGQSVDPYGLPVPQNYLNGVSPQGNPYGNALRNEPPGFVDVDIEVTEGRTGRLMFGAGFNSDAGVVGSITLQEDNFDIMRVPTSWSDITNGLAFRGNGESFRLELVPGNQVSRYSVSWRNPYFMGTDYSLGVDGFYYNRFFQDWTEERAGGRISVGYLFNRNWSAGVSLRLEDVGFSGFRTPAPALYNAAAGHSLLSTVQGRVTYDARDSSFLPSSGHMVEFAYEQAFGEFSYPHIDFTGSQYFTVYSRPDGGGKHILQFRGQVSWLGNGAPVYERLFAGGFQTFRGFSFRGVSPRQGTFRIGGDFMAIGSTEYSFPLTAGDGIRGVVFSDFGTVDDGVSFDKFRASAGFGFRVSVPAIGPAPLAFDLAWPITKQADDNTQVFSFYVGSAW